MGSNLQITESIEKYIEEYSQSLDPVQKEIISYNESLGEIKKMQIAVSQCYFLELITKVTNFKNILEVGTFTGLSTLSMALGLPKDGKIVALDKDSKTNQAAVNFFKKAGQDNKIKTIIKAALETLKELKDNNEIFDLVFIDADKANYINYFDAVIERMNPGGLIIADNILWKGKVLDEKKDKRTKVLDDYNKKILEDARVENVLLPIRDGLMVARVV